VFCSAPERASRSSHEGLADGRVTLCPSRTHEAAIRSRECPNFATMRAELGVCTRARRCYTILPASSRTVCCDPIPHTEEVLCPSPTLRVPMACICGAMRA